MAGRNAILLRFRDWCNFTRKLHRDALKSLVSS